jgi:hypothetical protein
MVANVWLDRETGKLTYNLQDPRYPLLTKGAGVDKEAEIDPTQRLAASDGRSPAPILVSTFSDELALSNAGKSKIFGISVKDRGAIPMAGHAGKAFWFSKAPITSQNAAAAATRQADGQGLRDSCNLVSDC